jgi:hypothetical protein
VALTVNDVVAAENDKTVGRATATIEFDAFTGIGDSLLD